MEKNDDCITRDLNHIKFRIDRNDRSRSFLELDGHRVRFMGLEVFSDGSRNLPYVKISMFSQDIQGEIIGATVEKRAIKPGPEFSRDMEQDAITEKANEGTEGESIEDDGCPGK